MITMQYNPRTGRVLVETSDKSFDCPPSMLSADNDWRDCLNRAIAAPAEKHVLVAHPKRSSITTFRNRAA